ncbi:hypothetical protein CEXT_9141 [Caerostris extrusa]|uniref:Uncharacterized protein n=1 Tax=Caerostris extrusa TaxID=172846 RepID=A0AAV4XK23_CAEEX|nr:hypothetical protein CEXT_9141 [Caerostris extrusa]
MPLKRGTRSEGSLVMRTAELSQTRLTTSAVRNALNPTLGEFCFAMIGRADIEGSKKRRRYERLAATSQLSLWYFFLNLLPTVSGREWSGLRNTLVRSHPVGKSGHKWPVVIGNLWWGHTENYRKHEEIGARDRWQALTKVATGGKSQQLALQLTFESTNNLCGQLQFVSDEASQPPKPLTKRSWSRDAVLKVQLDRMGYALGSKRSIIVGNLLRLFTGKRIATGHFSTGITENVFCPPRAFHSVWLVHLRVMHMY